jgi:hypothetical protein
MRGGGYITSIIIIVSAYILDVTANNNTEVIPGTNSTVATTAVPDTTPTTTLQSRDSHITFVGIAFAAFSLCVAFAVSIGVIMMRYRKIVNTHTADRPNRSVTSMRSYGHSIPNMDGLSTTPAIYTEDMTHDVVDGSYIQGMVQLPETDSRETLSLAETVCIHEED